MFKKSALLLTLCLFSCAFTSEAIGTRPEALNREEAALIGLYKGPGVGFIVREEGGQLEIVYPSLRQSEAKLNASQQNIWPLTREHYDAYTWQENSPNFTIEDTISFERDKEGQGINLRMGEKSFTRRFTHGTRIVINARLEDLRKEAQLAPVPHLPYTRSANLVPLKTIVPDLVYDLRYTTNNNLFDVPLVNSKTAYLDREAALALKKANEKLRSYGYGLVVWEAYRSWEDFKLATLLLGTKYTHMLPPATKGFSHNTGRTIAVSLYDRATHEELKMISDFDELTPAQYSDYLGGTSLERWHRDLLKECMESVGFTGSQLEWWHFDYNLKEKYQILNTSVK